MNLLDLPVELFASIIHDYVSEVGVHWAWKARQVCRTFAHLIDADVFSNQPLQAFVTCKPRPWYNPGPIHSNVLLQNLGRFILARTQKPLGVDPRIPSSINRCLDFLMQFEEDATTHVERQLQITRELCNAAAANPAYHLGLDVCSILEPTWAHSSLTRQESNPLDLLAASVVISNQTAVSRCVRDGASLWKEGDIFQCPLAISMHHSSDSDMTRYLLELIESSPPVQSDEIQMMYRMFVEITNRLVRDKQTDKAIRLLIWIYGSALPPPDKQNFNSLLSTAINTNDCTATEAALRIRVKSSPKVLWEHYLRVSQLDNVELLTTLIEKGNFKINRGFWNNSPLNEAVGRGLMAFVRKLLEAGAHPNGPTDSNRPGRSRDFTQPLRTAVVNENLKMMDLLFEYGATLAGTNGDWNKETLFAIAKTLPDARIMQRLSLAQKEEEKAKPAVTKAKKKLTKHSSRPTRASALAKNDA